MSVGLLKRVSDDLVEAMKARREMELSTIRMLKAEFQRTRAEPGRSSDLSDDECIAVVQRLISQGSINPEFYIDVAEALGFEVTITEFRPFRAGLSVAGDALTNGDWVFAWQMNAPAETVNYFKAGSGSAGEPLAYWGNDILECVIERLAPAGTIVLFSYGS